jgi:hypothetical protein
MRQQESESIGASFAGMPRLSAELSLGRAGRLYTDSGDPCIVLGLFTHLTAFMAFCLLMLRAVCHRAQIKAISGTHKRSNFP